VTTLTTIETPERVAFTYDVAGLGTRVIAYLIDLGFRIAILLLIMVAFASLVGQVDVSGLPSWLPTAGLVGLFLLQWGYLTLFEGLCVVDFLPALYGVGVIAIFFTDRHQRLGDIVAGTLVVRQGPRRPPALQGILQAHTRADAAEAPTGIRLELPLEEFEAVVEFLDRADGIQDEARRRIAAKFAATVRRRIAESKTLRERYPADELDDETLLRLAVRQQPDRQPPAPPDTEADPA